MKSWSVFSRITHWFIAVPVLLDFFLEGGDPPHKILGYVALAFVGVRFVWGFFAQDEAQFSYFHVEPKRIVHVAIWVVVLSLGVTGYMMGTDAFWGVDWVEELHEGLAKVLMGLVFVHFAGIGLDAWKFKRKTWLGMITGRR